MNASNGGTDRQLNTQASKPPLKLLACSGSLDGGGSERQLWQLVSHLDRSDLHPVFTCFTGAALISNNFARCPGARVRRRPPCPAAISAGPHFATAEPTSSTGSSIASIDIVYDRTFHMSLITGSLPRTLPRVSVIVSPPSRDLPQSERRFLFLKRWLLARAYRTARKRSASVTKWPMMRRVTTDLLASD